MKKVFALITAIILSNCEIKVEPRQANAQNAIIAGGVTYRYKTEYIDNMKFGIWYATGGTSQTGYDIEIINLTKESLEVELLRNQLSKNEKVKH